MIRMTGWLWLYAKVTCSIGQPKLSGGTPDTSWSVLQNHYLGKDLPDLYNIATNLKYGTLYMLCWGGENTFWASWSWSLWSHIIDDDDQQEQDDDEGDQGDQQEQDDEGDHLQMAALSSLQEECFHDPSVESMKTQEAPSPACLLSNVKCYHR